MSSEPPQYPEYPQQPQEGAGGPSPYGAPGPYGYVPVPDQPQATTALVLGILGIAICGVIAPFAWSVGRRSLREIDASGGRWGGRGKAQAGYILGIIGTVLLILAVVGGLALFAVGVSTSSST